MNLLKIIKDVELTKPFNGPDFEIQHITDDSREVRAGSMFVAVKGYEHDGHVYIDEAISNGAQVIVGEKDLTLPTTYVQVQNSKQALGKMLCEFYEHPSYNKKVIGVTGTNGKTTTSYMLKAAFEANGYSVGLIGTIEYFINGKSYKSKNTTPGTVKLQGLLHESQDDVVIVEISSHALKQHRVEGLRLDAAIFTNLDSEHLDYHHSMAEYFDSKFKIFSLLKSDGAAFVNIDDEWGGRAFALLREKNQTVYSVGVSSLADMIVSSNDRSVTVKSDNQLLALELKLPGMHNRFNAAFSLLVGEIFNLNRNKSVAALKQVENVSGRFEIINFPGNKTIVVDYAHTPKGFYHVLNTVKESGANKVIHVFGFRGSRDSSKRKAMMDETVKVSDQYILTCDDLNGTSENEMEQTLQDYHYQYQQGEVILDRTRAIEKAIATAGSGDWVVVTGKGHEAYKEAFDLGTTNDLETVETLKKREQEVLKSG